MTKHFSIPFAAGGDKSSTPNSIQPDGSVSYSEGFTADYALPNTDPDYKPIPRLGWNGLMFDVTEAVGEIQSRGILSWRNDVDYTPGASVIGSDGFYYKAAQSSGPATAPRDPTTQPAYWHGPSDIRKPPLTVDTVDDMIALINLVNGVTVKTAGNTSAGDGGYGDYLYFSSPPGTADGLIYRNQTTGGGQFKLKHNNKFNAAQADGATEADKIATAIAAIKSSAGGHGILIIPASFSSATVVPALSLSNNQSIAIIDLRTNRPSPPFGAVEIYVEGRDSSGGYASEFNVKGKQNPAVVVNSLSDGTAAGYPVANNASSFLHRVNGSAWYQYLTDPLFRGYGDWGLYQYTNGGTGSFAIRSNSDGNFKSRFDFTPINLRSDAIAISSVTDTTPVVVNLSAPHGIVATRSYVSISGVTAALNGSWIASVTGASQLTLLNSTAAGAFGAVGTATVSPNAQRATVNIPATQGGNEAMCLEGQLASAVLHSSGLPPITTNSQFVDVNFHARPYIVNINGVQQVSGTPGSGTAKIVEGNISLSGGSATVTLTGGAQFTSTSTYKVTCQDITAANATKVTKNNGASFTITGTGTDSIDFIAVGF